MRTCIKFMGEFKKWNVNGRNSRIYVKLSHKTYRLKSSEGSTELDVKVVHPQSWPWMLAWWVLYYP